MLLGHRFSELFWTAPDPNVDARPVTQPTAWNARGAGKTGPTEESSSDTDASSDRWLLRFAGRLEKFFLRCVEKDVARAARGHFWPWP